MSTNTTTALQTKAILEHEENNTTIYHGDLFDDEGPFGEADCAGL